MMRTASVFVIQALLLHAEDLQDQSIGKCHEPLAAVPPAIQGLLLVQSAKRLSKLRPSDTDDSLVGHWSFEGDDATMNADSQDRSATWQWSFLDLSGKAGSMQLQRWNFQNPYARKLPGQGLDGTDGIGFGGRSAARGEVPPFRSASFWMMPEIGCCKRMVNIISAKRSNGKGYFTLGVHFGRLWAGVYSETGQWLAVARLKNGFQPAVESRWRHCAVVMRSDKLEIFMDGELMCTGPGSLGDQQLGSDSLTLQLGTGHPHNQFFGIMDEVKLFTGDLTAEQVRNLMDERSGGPPRSTTTTTTKAPLRAAFPGDLLGHWRFDDPVGSRHWRDDSAQGNRLVSRRTSGSQHMFAELLQGVGLGGSGAMRTYSRSCAKATVPWFRSIAFWIKRDAGCCNRISDLVKVEIDSAKVFRVYVHYEKLIVELTNFEDVSGQAWNAKTTYTITEDGTNWDHLAVVIGEYDFTIYLNGQATQDFQHYQQDYSGRNATLQFGTCGPHHQVLGILDELRIYSHPLGLENITKLAAAEHTGGTMAGENLPPRVDAGPTLTLWKPLGSATLAGSCTDQDAGPQPVVAKWSVVPSPGSSHLQVADPEQASTELSFLDGAPSGDYLLELACSDGELTRKELVAVVVFEAHEETVGKTVESLGSQRWGFADQAKGVTPVGLWLFDGGLESALGGREAATVVNVRHSGNAPFVQGRFGQALSLHCDDDYCVQLDLGNPEKQSPWQAMSVSLWFKTNKTQKLAFVSKGVFSMASVSEADKNLQEATWHHYVIAIDSNVQKGYLDGRLLFMKSGAANRTQADADDNLTFGIRGGHASYGFDGIVDEIGVFDFVLSNEEVEMLYTKSASEFTKRGTMNPLWRGGFNETGLGYFPDLTEEADFGGYVGGQEPSSNSPKAYVHPRIFFTPDELPALRVRLRETTAGRVAMENLRGLLREQYIHPFSEFMDKNYTSFDGLDQQLVQEAFRCLIDGDRGMAVRVGQQLDVMADAMQATLDATLRNFQASAWELKGTSYDNTNTWKDIGQVILARGTTVAFIYDFIYPWLSSGTRAKVRKLISTATMNTWSIGMDAVEGYSALVSNWIPWVTGDLILTMLAIEGEDGFDTGVYARAARVYRGWGTLGISAVSGATFEGGGKNAATTPKFLALAKHGYPKYIGMPGIRKFGTKFLLHTMLPSGLFWEDDVWGGIELKPQLADVCGLKFAFPDDKAIDFVYRNSVHGDGYAGVYKDWGGGEGVLPFRQFAPSRTRTYVYNNFVTAVIYAMDWGGPADYAEHAEFALGEEPLTYVAEDRGLLATRSSWTDKDAAWLLFNVRSLPGGHAAPGRGEFCFHALGETWAFYNSGHNNVHSRVHSVILVDGEGQENGVPGHFLDYKDTEEATFGTMCARHAYGIKHFGGSWGGQTVNKYMIQPGPYKWENLKYNELPSWYVGTGSQVEASDRLTPPGAFVKAFRTVGMVRSSPQPYALVFDDIQKDDYEHVYAWRMMLRREFFRFMLDSGLHEMVAVNRDYFKPDGQDAILRDSAGGPARLLVRLLPGSSESASAEIQHAFPSALQIQATAVSARFRVLLYPLKDEDTPIPETSWDETSSMLKVGQDEIKLQVTDEGATKVEWVQLATGS